MMAGGATTVACLYYGTCFGFKQRALEPALKHGLSHADTQGGGRQLPQQQHPLLLTHLRLVQPKRMLLTAMTP